MASKIRNIPGFGTKSRSEERRFSVVISSRKIFVLIQTSTAACNVAVQGPKCCGQYFLLIWIRHPVKCFGHLRWIVSDSCSSGFAGLVILPETPRHQYWKRGFWKIELWVGEMFSFLLVLDFHGFVICVLFPTKCKKLSYLWFKSKQSRRTRGSRSNRQIGRRQRKKTELNLPVFALWWFLKHGKGAIKLIQKVFQCTMEQYTHDFVCVRFRGKGAKGTPVWIMIWELHLRSSATASSSKSNHNLIQLPPVL